MYTHKKQWMNVLPLLWYCQCISWDHFDISPSPLGTHWVEPDKFPPGYWYKFGESLLATDKFKWNWK